MRKIKLALLVLSVTVNLLILVALVTMFATGKLDSDKLNSIIGIITREEKTKELIKPQDNVEVLWREYREKMKERESEVQSMEQKLKELKSFVSLKLDEMDRLNNELVTLNKQLQDKRKELEDFKKDWEGKQKETNFILNLSRFAKMEPEAVVDIFRNLTDDEVRMYLNNMKASQVAELLELMRSDAEFSKRLKNILFDIVEADK